MPWHKFERYFVLGLQNEVLVDGEDLRSRRRSIRRDVKFLNQGGGDKSGLNEGKAEANTASRSSREWKEGIVDVRVE